MLKIVIGYVAGVDVLPRDARRQGLARRVAFVLETYRPDRDPHGSYFDVGLYAELVESTCTALRVDAMRGNFRAREEVNIDPGALRSLLDQQAETEREPLWRIRMVREGSTVALLGSDLWVLCGGPDPYHDSYTIPVYTHEDVSGELEAAARTACNSVNAKLTDVIRASEKPAPGLLDRAMSFLGL
jgi:hypothetical protein